MFLDSSTNFNLGSMVDSQTLVKFSIYPRNQIFYRSYRMLFNEVLVSSLSILIAENHQKNNLIWPIYHSPLLHSPLLHPNFRKYPSQKKSWMPKKMWWLIIIFPRKSAIDLCKSPNISSRYWLYSITSHYICSVLHGSIPLESPYILLKITIG